MERNEFICPHCHSENIQCFEFVNSVMRKFFTLMFVILVMSSTCCFAMTFSQPVEIGGIGFPVQSPYHGYIVKNATQNDGESYYENSNLIKTPIYTYKKGIAQWGNDEAALYCDYVFKSNDSSIKFGGKNNYIISTESF